MVSWVTSVTLRRIQNGTKPRGNHSSHIVACNQMDNQRVNESMMSHKESSPCCSHAIAKLEGAHHGALEQRAVGLYNLSIMKGRTDEIGGGGWTALSDNIYRKMITTQLSNS